MRPGPAGLKSGRTRPITGTMQIGPVDAKTAAARETQPPGHRHVYPTSRPPAATASTEPEPTAAPAPASGRGTAQSTPTFTHRLEEALQHDGRLSDLKGGLTRRQVDRMLAGLPPGGFGGDFAHMSPAHLKALGQLMRGEAGPVAPGEPRRYTFDPSGPVGTTTRPA
jgi:hypothetical protein